MEVVLIDKFVAPEESKFAFLTEVRKSSAFLRTLPGFVEGFVYERAVQESRQQPCLDLQYSTITHAIIKHWMRDQRIHPQLVRPKKTLASVRF